MKKRRSCAGILVKTGVILLCAYFLVYYGGAALLRSIYPIRYEETVLQASEETGLPPSLLFAVIKTESDFDPAARSHAGAVGLMQMIPDTFYWIQEKNHGEIVLEEEALLDASSNIRYGSLLLKWLIDRYGNLNTALCAYNAGMGAVDGWLSDPAYSQDGITLSKIPYSETSRYIKRIALARHFYQRLYGLS